MLIILLLVGIGLIILGSMGMSEWDWYEGIGIPMTMLGIVALITLVVVIPIAITNTIKIPQMEERIAIYKEENTRIEEQIKTVIETYQDYEQGIFEDIDLDEISSEKLILLTSIYPELKSDAMIQELIQVYINNTNEIKSLRTQKLDHELWRWWLCFV